MSVIWKYELEHAGKCDLEVPEGATPLCVLNQRERLVMHMLVPDHMAEKITRRFMVAGTGSGIIPPGGTYVGTAMLCRGDLVWHVFDLGKVFGIPPKPG